MTTTDGYAYLWEFEVDPRHREAFLRHYGGEGSWARLFRRSPGYLGTLLLEDEATPGRFLTLDRWQSREHWLGFRAQFAEDYQALDRECEDLTRSERSLGSFVAPS